MPLVTSVEIHGFRGFKELRVDGLTRVNLVVGANNAGKTALLEAIEAVVSVDNPSPLYRASFERSEFRSAHANDSDRIELDVRHWFHGHEIAKSAQLSVDAVGERKFSFAARVLAAFARPKFSGGLMLSIVRSDRPPIQRALPADGFLAATASAFVDYGLRLQPPVGFVTTERQRASDLAKLWAAAILTPREQRTLEALRLVEPSLERIAISEAAGNTTAQVLLRGASTPVPLGSLGEGVSRMLALALHLSAVEGGYLFVDEIENGLHWSAVPKVLRFLVENARTLGVQVFAATHSKDWVEGLAALHRDHPELAAEVSVHRLERGRATSTRFDAERIDEYVEMEMEAR